MGACRTCGRELPDDARFCPSCGTQVADDARATADERKLVTVLFADAVGSTALGERLDPERLQDVQRSLFATMRDVITAEGGTVEKYAGDSVMAVFGAPVAHEDDAARALRAAQHLHERVGELGLQLRIGVNTGEAVAAGATSPDTALVTGDVVNVAARLEQLAGPGQTVVAARTARSCPGLRTRPLGAVEVRGRHAPVDALVVVGGDPAPRRGIPGAHVPMVGRDRELALLVTVFERAVAGGRPELVTIYGEPGVGKSRLARELGARLETQRPETLVVRGRCLPYGDGITYWPLAEILKSVAGVLDSDPPAAAGDKIAALGARLLTPERVPDPAMATAALAYTIGLDGSGTRHRNPLADADPRRVRTEMHTAWRAFFSALAAEQPVCVVVEDVHWADPGLLDLLHDVAERAVGPLLLVCPSRPDLAATVPTWGAGRRSTSVTLDPLDEAAATHLVDLLLDHADLPAAARRRIVARAEGNPFFLEEIVRQLADEGRADATALDLPDTVQGVLAARIDLLDPVVKRVAQQAAVVGREFWTGAVVALTGLDDGEVARALDALEEREVIVARPSSSLAGQREYAFKHILTRDVAYEGLVRRDRADAHVRMSSWIEATFGARCCELAELLAHHRLSAYRAASDAGVTGDDLETLRRGARVALLDASADASSRYALAKARRLADEALSMAVDDAERAEAHEALGDSLWLGHGTGTEAWTHYTRAAAIHQARRAADPSDREVAIALARTCARAVEIPTRWPASMRVIPEAGEVRRYLDLGLAHVPDGDSPERVCLLVAVAMWPTAFEKGTTSDVDIDAARQAGEDAEAMARRLGRYDLASAALDGTFGYFQYAGRYGDGAASALIDRRLSLLPRLTSSSEIGDAFAMGGWQRYSAGRYAEAAEIAAAGAARVREDAPPWALHCLVWLAKARFRLGDHDGVLECARESDEILGSERERPASFCTPLYGVAAVVHTLRGDAASARAAIGRTGVDETVTAPRSLLTAWLARAAAFAGDFGAADGHIVSGRDLLGGEGRADVLEARCELAVIGRRWATADVLASEARGHAAFSGHLVLPFHADRLEGAAAMAAGEVARGRELLRRAADGFASIGGAWDAAWTRLLLDGDDAALVAMGVAPAVIDRLRAV